MTIAACPKCHDEVTVPPGAPRTAQVRCPWCREEFELSDVLDRLPPVLEIVGGPSLAESAPKGWGEFADASEGEIRIAEPNDAAPTAKSFDFPETNPLGGVGGHATAVAVPRAPGTKVGGAKRPRRKEKSVAVEMVKVALGGVVGLILAQLILWWLPEPYKRDPAELGPVVGKYMPWIVPKSLRQDSSQGTIRSDSSPDLGVTANQQRIASNASDPATARNTSGGQLASGQAPGQATNPPTDAALPTLPSDTPLQAEPYLALDTPTETDAAMLPDDPLEIPEPDLSLDPGAALTIDPPTLAADSGNLPSTAESPSTDEMPIDQDDAPTQDLELDAPSEPPTGSVAEPAVAPQTSEDAFVGVNDAPMFVKDEVSKALEQAQAARQATEAAAAGEENASANAFYTALTDLAEKLTYGDAHDASIDEIAQQTKELLLQGNVRDTAMLLVAQGPVRLASGKEERPNSGIVLFGRVESVEKRGALYETRLQLPPGASGPSVVPVFGAEEPDHGPGDTLIVLGTMVEEPAKRLSGYEGRLPSLVWMGESIEIGK